MRCFASKYSGESRKHAGAFPFSSYCNGLDTFVATNTPRPVGAFSQASNRLEDALPVLLATYTRTIALSSIEHTQSYFWVGAADARRKPIRLKKTGRSIQHRRRVHHVSYPPRITLSMHLVSNDGLETADSTIRMEFSLNNPVGRCSSSSSTSSTCSPLPYFSFRSSSSYLSSFIPTSPTSFTPSPSDGGGMRGVHLLSGSMPAARIAAEFTATACQHRR